MGNSNSRSFKISETIDAINPSSSTTTITNGNGDTIIERSSNVGGIHIRTCQIHSKIITTSLEIHHQDKEENQDLSHKQLLVVPPFLFNDNHIVSLDLSNNFLEFLPDAIGNLGRLRRLALGSNKLKGIPDSIGLLHELIWLDFTHNTSLDSFPDNTISLLKLQSLGLSDCNFHEFPKGILNLRSLRKIGLFGNMLTRVPPEIAKLKLLTKIDLSNNAITDLPLEIGQLSHLTWLNLSNNGLRSLPLELNNLKELQELGLSNNRLKSLPDLSNLKKLILLPVFNNEIETIGEWIGQLPNLQKIDLSNNAIKSLSKNFFSSPELVYVNLRGNLLENIPNVHSTDPSIKHRGLQQIDLRDNRLAFIPSSLLGHELLDIKCSGNPFNIPSLSTLIPSLTLSSPSIHSIESPMKKEEGNEQGNSNHIDSLLTLCLQKYLIDPAFNSVGNDSSISNLMASYKLPPSLCHLIWEKSQGAQRCFHCLLKFTTSPKAHYESIAVSDHPSVIVEYILCSYRCKNLMEKRWKQRLVNKIYTRSNSNLPELIDEVFDNVIDSNNR